MTSVLVYYTIYATPSDHRHCAHTVGLCSTKEKATKAIGSGRSYDMDDNVHWTYTVGVVEASTLSEYELSKVDKLPGHFPYTGW